MARALLARFSEVCVAHLGEVREPNTFRIIAELLEECRRVRHSKEDINNDTT